jgi:hypothetical protein
MQVRQNRITPDCVADVLTLQLSGYYDAALAGAITELRA